MGRSRRGEKEITKEKRLSLENQQLKREIGRLRKELARFDLDRYETVKEAIEEHEERQGLSTTEDLLSAMKKEWACQENGCEGHLEIVRYNKINATWYYRTCTHCKNRTKSQKYSPSVKGIVRNKENHEET